jgi:uracil-DNA glycosylase
MTLYVLLNSELLRHISKWLQRRVTMSDTITELTNWSNEVGIDPDHFSCRNFASCAASVHGNLGPGTSAMMSYVGPQYDAGELTEGFSLAIVGMDHGDVDSGSYRDRTNDIISFYRLGGEPFNPHYAGVIRTAAAIFGQTGKRCETECVTRCRGACDDQQPCVLERIFQPNVAKCVPTHALNRTSVVSQRMRENCAYHLLAELTIARPNLIVLHGAAVHSAFLMAVKATSQDVQISNFGNVQIVAAECLPGPALLLHHPSRGWLDRQWQSSVLPALELLRSQGHIPA